MLSIFPLPHGLQIRSSCYTSPPLFFPPLHLPHKCVCAFFGEFQHTWLHHPFQDATNNETSTCLSFIDKSGASGQNLCPKQLQRRTGSNIQSLPFAFSFGSRPLIPSDSFSVPCALCSIRRVYSAICMGAHNGPVACQSPCWCLQSPGRSKR